jgi:hypothetical protein
VFGIVVVDDEVCTLQRVLALDVQALAGQIPLSIEPLDLRPRAEPGNVARKRAPQELGLADTNEHGEVPEVGERALEEEHAVTDDRARYSDELRAEHVEVEGVVEIALGREAAAPVALLTRAEEVIAADPCGADERGGELVGEGRLAGGVRAVDADAPAARGAPGEVPEELLAGQIGTACRSR